jgi:hypothetical protein
MCYILSNEFEADEKVARATRRHFLAWQGFPFKGISKWQTIDFADAWNYRIG